MFYSYLWLPWEEELDSNRHNDMNEWIADNLDGRLGL